jgi:hypothetical protein
MRGQAHTIEAFAAAVLVVGGLIFATQATAVTPLSASTSNQHIENQQAATIEGLLATAAENGTLTEAVLYWNESRGTFQDAPDGGVHAEGPPISFGAALNELLLDRRIAFNVNVRYPDGSGETAAEPMVRMGEPSNNAVSATRSVGLYNRSTLSTGTDAPTLETAGSDFYAPNIADGQLYTVVEVEVIAWRK